MTEVEVHPGLAERAASALRQRRAALAWAAALLGSLIPPLLAFRVPDWTLVQVWAFQMGLRGLLEAWLWSLGADAPEHRWGHMLTSAALAGLAGEAWLPGPWSSVATAWTICWLSGFYWRRRRGNWLALVLWDAGRLGECGS